MNVVYKFCMGRIQCAKRLFVYIADFFLIQIRIFVHEGLCWKNAIDSNKGLVEHDKFEQFKICQLFQIKETNHRYLTNGE